MVLHADQGYATEPWPPVPLAVNVGWILDDFTEEVGATRYVPGSHRAGGNPDPERTYETVPVEAPAGSLLVMDGRIWHQSGINRTPDPSPGGAVRLLRPLLDPPPGQLERLPRPRGGGVAQPGVPRPARLPHRLRRPARRPPAGAGGECGRDARGDLPELRRAYREDGAICVPGLLDPAALALARAAFDWSVAHPGPAASRPFEGIDGAFYQDLCNPVAPLERALPGVLHGTPVAELVTGLWDDPAIWFMYEQVFLKEGGENRRTPWHQDAPYLSVEGDHLAVVWISLRPRAPGRLARVRARARTGPRCYNTSAFDPDRRDGRRSTRACPGCPTSRPTGRRSTSSRGRWSRATPSCSTRPCCTAARRPIPAAGAARSRLRLLRSRRRVRRAAGQRRGADGRGAPRAPGAGHAVPARGVPRTDGRRNRSRSARRWPWPGDRTG